MSSHFFAMLSRMKYIHRWALMRNSYPENISEHSLEVAVLSHALATIGNVRLGKMLNAEIAALIAVFHDTPEIITGDMPTPIKNFNEDTRGAFKKVEDDAAEKLLALLPEDLRPSYEGLFFAADNESEEDKYIRRLVKAADRLSALIKCIEEAKAGNREFEGAMAGIKERLGEMHLPEVDAFCEEFLPSYEKNLDELYS